MKGQLLLIEDDLNFGVILKSYLEMNEYQVDLITDGREAIPTLNAQKYDLCIVDVLLPNIDGFSIVKHFRKRDKITPVIFLSAKSQKDDVIEGYRSGADDYMTKPFDSDLLLAKIKAILRRNGTATSVQSEMLTIGKFVFDVKLRLLQSDDNKYRLTPRESELLYELYLSRATMLSRKEALRKIWGDDNYFNARSMDVYITRLRKYFKDDPTINLVNVHGTGFILEF